jgi:preprotein translocase subunit SecA
MPQTKSAATDAAHEHEHGPECDHDHGHSHEALIPFKREAPKLGRNDPCHCGSGKKFKKCHGA